MVFKHVQKKWIATVVMMTFLSLIHLSAFPLQAQEHQTEGVSQVQDRPVAFEKIGAASAQGSKKSILPYVVIGVGVIAAAAILFLVVLKTSYDITGTWTVNYTWKGGSTYPFTITFSGDKKTGTFVYKEEGFLNYTGTYAVNIKNVEWTFSKGATKYTGTFTDKTHMSGTMVCRSGEVDEQEGTWTATKNSSTTSVNVPMATNKQGPKGNGETLK
jgi:hypothetical protein